MRVSFVILTYNRKQEVLETLQKTYSLMEGYQDYEIIVVENASADSSAKQIREEFPEVILIDRKVNVGIAGWNDGFEIAKGKYLIVLDDDSNVENGLQEALLYMDNNPKVGILALNIVGGPYVNGHLKDKQDYIAFIGCGAIIRKKLYDAIGGFAEWLHVYTHEYEYGLRCLNAGYKIKVFKGCNVVHRVSNINRSSKNMRIFSVRNEMSIIYKYFPSQRFKYILRLYLNNLKNNRKGGAKEFYYITKGVIEFFKVKGKLKYTPVSEDVKTLFSEYFNSLRPPLGYRNLKK